MEEINAKNIVDDTAPLESLNPQANSSDAVVADKQIEMSRVGKSVFYDCLELSPTAEKQDFMKPEQSDTDEESKNTHFECIKSTDKVFVMIPSLAINKVNFVFYTRRKRCLRRFKCNCSNVSCVECH